MRLIASDYNQFTGFTEEMWYEEPAVQGGPARITIRRLQDVDHQLAQNKIEYNSHVGKMPSYNDSKGLHKVAEIPMGLIEQWISEGFNWFQSTDKARKAKLNDSDFQKLLVRPGKL
jgi:hypothetical protein